MPYWENISASTYERPGDGEHPGWVAEPGAVVECDQNPAPGSFEAVDTPPPTGAPSPTGVQELAVEPEQIVPPADQPAAPEE